MKQSKRRIIIRELFWLIAILGIATSVEYAIIEFLDLHPVLSIKIQGLIGLMLIGYAIRMIARIWKPSQNPVDPNENGKEVLE